jgi:hypothetical protein
MTELRKTKCMDCEKFFRYRTLDCDSILNTGCCCDCLLKRVENGEDW